jgi:alpha 1,2-mannosyltransferase
MQDENKVYGFTLSLYEYIETIPTLWGAVKSEFVPPLSLSFSSLSGFIAEHPEHVAPDNAMQFLSDDGGETYNKCHCKCTSLRSKPL